MIPTNSVLTDGYRVTRDVATELCAHHLKLAQLFFEATPEGQDAMDEIIRILYTSDDIGMESPVIIAARAWLTAINTAYEDMKVHD